ncbi:MAG: CocE/NonD family hydrolase [Leptolyngbyaceae cyanobacterium bins.349]|nr:CocE/NonD family hydrolase [Leptolyngbyaceae cyanobacterium bins.349]
MTYRVLPKQPASMLTRDGVRLDADVYRPAAEGEFPVLLMRQPYGRAIASTVVYAHPIWYASQGYLVVIQDVRGRGTSAGEFQLFEHEIEDGYDAVEWAAQLPGSSGEVGMYGFSYQGMTQLYAAIAQPPALKAICPAMIGYDLYHDWAYENGAFCLQANLGWAIQIAAETARIQGDEAAHRQLAIAAKNLPLSDAVPPRSSLLTKLAPDSFYHDWLAHSEPDDYWAKLSPNTYLDQLNLPMLHIGGWFDTFLRGTINLYKAMADRSPHPQHLLVGPWAHLPWGRKVGALDFGPAANSPCDRLQIRWFDHFLKGKNTDLFGQPPIQLFLMGINEWRYFDTWNATPSTPFSLTSTGLAAMDEQDGQLLPPASSPPSPASPSSPPPFDILVHDPWRPVPAFGGHASFPTGPQERSALDCRSDILTYTSAPLAEPLYLVGEISLSLICRADVPSFDLCAVLAEVRPNGTIYNFAQGYIHVNPGQSTEPLTFALQPTAMCIQAGYALRLSLSAACFPAYPVNPGTGQAIQEAQLIDQQIITVLIEVGEASLSQLLLPDNS